MKINLQNWDQPRAISKPTKMVAAQTSTLRRKRTARQQWRINHAGMFEFSILFSILFSITFWKPESGSLYSGIVDWHIPSTASL